MDADNIHKNPACQKVLHVVYIGLRDCNLNANRLYFLGWLRLIYKNCQGFQFLQHNKFSENEERINLENFNPYKENFSEHFNMALRRRFCVDYKALKMQCLIHLCIVFL